MLPQEPALALDPTMRVRSQVAEGALGASRATARRRAEAALTDVGLAQPRRGPTRTPCRAAWRSGWRTPRPPSAAHACSSSTSRPRGSTPSSVDRLAELLGAHVGDGGLLLTITHDLRLAAALGGEVVVMREATRRRVRGRGRRAGRPAARLHPATASTPSRPGGSRPWQRTGWDSPHEAIVRAIGVGKSYGATGVFAACRPAHPAGGAAGAQRAQRCRQDHAGQRPDRAHAGRHRPGRARPLAGRRPDPEALPGPDAVVPGPGPDRGGAATTCRAGTASARRGSRS